MTKRHLPFLTSIAFMTLLFSPEQLYSQGIPHPQKMGIIIDGFDADKSEVLISVQGDSNQSKDVITSSDTLVYVAKNPDHFEESHCRKNVVYRTYSLIQEEIVL